MNVWLPSDVESEAELSTLLESIDWIMQEKVDGKHVLSVIDKDGVTHLNKKGTPTRFPVDILKTLSTLPSGTTLDGELLSEKTGPYIVYDVPQFDSIDLKTLEYGARLLKLATVTEELASRKISLVDSWMGKDQKIQAFERLKLERAEGVIFKHIDAKYPGQLGTMKRWKFKKRLDCVLGARNDGTQSFEMFVFDDSGKSLHIGSVNAASFWGQLAPGDFKVAEVEFLYSTPSRKLYQPVVIRLRDDKGQEECRASQLVIGKRFG